MREKMITDNGIKPITFNYSKSERILFNLLNDNRPKHIIDIITALWPQKEYPERYEEKTISSYQFHCKDCKRLLKGRQLVLSSPESKPCSSHETKRRAYCHYCREYTTDEDKVIIEKKKRIKLVRKYELSERGHLNRNELKELVKKKLVERLSRKEKNTWRINFTGFFQEIYAKVLFYPEAERVKKARYILPSKKTLEEKRERYGLLFKDEANEKIWSNLNTKTLPSRIRQRAKVYTKRLSESGYIDALGKELITDFYNWALKYRTFSSINELIDFIILALGHWNPDEFLRRFIMQHKLENKEAISKWLIEHKEFRALIELQRVCHTYFVYKLKSGFDLMDMMLFPNLDFE